MKSSAIPVLDFLGRTGSPRKSSLLGSSAYGLNAVSVPNKKNETETGIVYASILGDFMSLKQHTKKPWMGKAMVQMKLNFEMNNVSHQFR